MLVYRINSFSGVSSVLAAVSSVSSVSVLVVSSDCFTDQTHSVSPPSAEACILSTEDCGDVFSFMKNVILGCSTSFCSTDLVQLYRAGFNVLARSKYKSS